MERQKITDEAEAEKARRELLELQANSAAVESTGQAKAEAQSRAEASRIEGEAAVEQAKLKAQASKIEAVSCLFSYHVNMRNLNFASFFFYNACLCFIKVAFIIRHHEFDKSGYSFLILQFIIKCVSYLVVLYD